MYALRAVFDFYEACQMKGYAPGWQLRCTKCGATWSAAESGIFRIKESVMEEGRPQAVSLLQ
jgi:hypothetical protein